MDRVAYALTRAWVQLAFWGIVGTLGMLITVSARTYVAAVVVAVASAGFAALVVATTLGAESDSRKIAVAAGWDYSTWGPAVGEYRVWAPPFTTTRGARTVRRSTLTVTRGHRSTVVERVYVPRDTFHWTGDDFVELVHLDEAFSTVRLVRNTLDSRGLGDPISVSTELAEFNARWVVVSEDPAFAHAWLTPQVQEILLRLGEIAPRVTISGSGLYAYGHKQFAAHGDHVIELLGQIARAMPGGVAQKYGQDLDSDETIPSTAVHQAVAALDGPRRVAPRALGGRGPFLAVAAAVLAVPVPILGAIFAIAAIGAPDSGRRWARVLAWIALAVSVGYLAGEFVFLLVNA